VRIDRDEFFECSRCTKDHPF